MGHIHNIENNMSRIHFITFANTSYMNPNRILEQAKSFNIFTSIKGLNENDIPEYITQHHQFIQDHPEGYGRFIWKPKIIYDKLLTMEDNDILLYCDAGCHLNINGIDRFNKYLTSFVTNDVLAFLTPNVYKTNYYVKNDAVMSYFPELHKHLRQYMYAGVVFVKKTPSSLRMIYDWLSLSQNYHFLDSSNSIEHPEVAGFIGQDSDNGLFALCVYKFQSIVSFIEPHEVSVYLSSGYQTYHNTNWSTLDKFPIQCRRDRPSR